MGRLLFVGWMGYEYENSPLVRQLDNRWNHLYSSMIEMQDKLVSLGVVLVDGEVAYLGEREASNV